MAEEYTLDTSKANARQGQRRTAAAKSVVAAPAAAATSVTQRSGSYSGKGMLTAELLAGFMIIAIRVVANYELQSDGTVKGKVLRPHGEYGPMTVFAGLVITFFVLSFLAASGGLKAKMAVILGGSIVLTLGVKSYQDILVVSNTIGHIGQIVVPDPSGSQSSVLGTQANAGTGATGTPAQQQAAAQAAAANPETPGFNAATAGTRAIASIKSPFTQDVIKGNLLGIPKTVGTDAINLVKGLSDYLTSGVDYGVANTSNPITNFTGGLKSDFNAVKNFFGF